jgi:pyruvate decarboxylase
VPPIVQELSTLAKTGANPIILLINNKGYTIEEELHPGRYNHIAEWDYTALAQALAAGSDIFTAKVPSQ